MTECSGYIELDIILYNDGLDYNFDKYVDTIHKNMYLIEEFISKGSYDRVNLLMYSLPTELLNESLCSYVSTLNSHMCVKFVDSSLSMADVDGPCTSGMAPLIDSCTGDDILFIRLGDIIDSMDKPYNFEEIKNLCYSERTDSNKYVDLLNLSGLFSDSSQLCMLLNKINYIGYLTSDMVMLSVHTFMDYLYKNLKLYKLMDVPSNTKVHHSASLINFYDTLISRTYKKLVHRDQSTLLKKVVTNELGKS